ncbi:hypothetical protein ABEF95_013445 [Exophiala dermatitidis]
MSSSDPATIAANTLRAKQKPLKDKYRADPSSALVTLSSSGTLDPTSTSLTCSLSAGTAARKVAGLHKAAGGEGFDATGELCSGDMLLESLVACFGVTIRAVATSMGIAINDGSVKVEGDLDFRGTMGIKDADGNAVPVGFKKIRLFVSIDVGDSDEDKAKVGKLIELSERYCVVLQTLRAGVQVETSLNSGGDTSEGADRANSNAQQNIPANENVLKVN